jgi:FkbM family methyltransferase
MTAVALLQRVRASARFIAPNLMPVGLHRALTTRSALRARGLTGASLRAAYEVHAENVHLIPPEIDLDRALAVDLGANEGRWSAALLAVAPNARVIAVEPAPGPRALLERRFAGHPNVTIVGKAVGAAPGTATLNVTEHANNSSLRRPHDAQDAMYGDGFRVRDEVEVEVTTLDELVGDAVADVVKIDVQGLEIDVLRGGERTLERARAVLLETNFVSYYEGDATFDTLHQAMHERGFRLANIATPATRPDGAALWSDACYVRA